MFIDNEEIFVSSINIIIHLMQIYNPRPVCAVTGYQSNLAVWSSKRPIQYKGNPAMSYELRRNHSWAITPISGGRHLSYCSGIGLLANCSVRIPASLAREILSTLSTAYWTYGAHAYNDLLKRAYEINESGLNPIALIKMFRYFLTRFASLRFVK